jgi:hypothetical protein
VVSAVEAELQAFIDNEPPPLFLKPEFLDRVWSDQSDPTGRAPTRR